MPGTGPINSRQVSPQSVFIPPPPQSTLSGPPVALPVDTLQPLSAPPEYQELTLNLKVRSELLQPNAQGQVPMDSLEPDFVPTKDLSPNAPQLVGAWETSEYNQEYRNAGFEQGYDEGYLSGQKQVVPPGHRVKPVDSQRGLLLELVRDQLTTTLPPTMGVSAGLGMAANYLMSSQTGAMLGVAAGPLQLVGGLTTAAKLEHQKAYLTEFAQSRPGEQALADKPIDIWPNSGLPITLGDATSILDRTVQGQYAKMGCGAALLGAGVASLMGFGPLATGLALGSLLAPASELLPTSRQISQAGKHKQQLVDVLQQRQAQFVAQGQTSDEALKSAQKSLIEQYLPTPVADAQGRAVGSQLQPQQVPLSDAIAHVEKSRKLLTFQAASGVAGAGNLVALGLGCPMFLALGGMIGTLALTGAVLFPSETLQGIKAFPGVASQLLQATAQALGQVAEQVGAKLGLVKPKELTAQRKALIEAAVQGPQAQAMIESQPVQQALGALGQDSAFAQEVMGVLLRREPAAVESWKRSHSPEEVKAFGVLAKMMPWQSLAVPAEVKPQDTASLSAGQKLLQGALLGIAEKDPQLAAGLQQSLALYSQMPQDEAGQRQALEQAKRHQAQLGQLQQQFPELARQYAAGQDAVAYEAALSTGQVSASTPPAAFRLAHATADYQQSLQQVRSRDPQLAANLEQHLQATHSTSDGGYAEAAQQKFQQGIERLAARDPKLAAQFKSDIQRVNRSQRELDQLQNQLQQALQWVEESLQSPQNQGLLDSGPVQASLGQLGKPRGFAETVLRTALQAQVLGDQATLAQLNGQSNDPQFAEARQVFQALNQAVAQQALPTNSPR